MEYIETKQKRYNLIKIKKENTPMLFIKVNTKKTKAKASYKAEAKRIRAEIKARKDARKSLKRDIKELRINRKQARNNYKLEIL